MKHKIISKLLKLFAGIKSPAFSNIAEGTHAGSLTLTAAEDIDIETEKGRDAAYLLEREDRWKVLEDVLSEFDAVVPMLPVQYGGSEVQRATQGAAYGMKARSALYFASIRKWD